MYADAQGTIPLADAYIGVDFSGSSNASTYPVSGGVLGASAACTLNEFLVSVGQSSSVACGASPSITIYSPSATLAQGVEVYTDAQGLNPVGNVYIGVDFNAGVNALTYPVSGGVLGASVTCPYSFQVSTGPSSGEACSNPQNDTIYSASQTLISGSTVFLDAALTVPVPDGWIAFNTQIDSYAYQVTSGELTASYQCGT